MYEKFNAIFHIRYAKTIPLQYFCSLKIFLGWFLEAAFWQAPFIIGAIPTKQTLIMELNLCIICQVTDNLIPCKASTTLIECGIW